MLTPICPGNILLNEFMNPLGLSQNKLAKHLKVPPTRIHEIIHGQRSITVDTALRLSKFFGTTPELWLELQIDYDLKNIRRGKGKKIEKEVYLHI